jgi:hypothetical protein
MARIDNGIVAEILTADPFPPFAPALVWVDCSTVSGIQEGWTYSNGTFAAPVVPAPTEAQYTAAAQALLDKGAQGLGYDSMLSLASYATSTNATFKAQALAGIAWRDAVWTAGYALVAAVQAGTQSAPTIAAFLASLPAASWPS